MASTTLPFFLLMLSFVRVGKSAESMVNLKCRPAVGVIGQTTDISCSIESQTDRIVIKTVVLTRIGEKNSCFAFYPFENSVTGDSRFKAENRPSLQLHNTAVSDEGEYRYYIRTSLGNVYATFTVNVTAKYSSPIITSLQTEIVDDGPADLYCSASGGYPAGTIHWFTQGNTNWTKSATLQSSQGNDGLFTLSSKLSFQKIDTSWAPFRCVVLNNKYEEEGGSTSNLKIIDNPERPPEPPSGVNNQMKNIIAGVIVIGSLIVGLLIVLLFKRRRDQRVRRASACPILSPLHPEVIYNEVDQALNEPVYKNAADAEEKLAV